MNTEILTKSCKLRDSAVIAARAALDNRRRPLARLQFRRESGRLMAAAIAINPSIKDCGIPRPVFKISARDAARHSKLYNGILARLDSRKATTIERRLMEGAQELGLCDMSGRWYNLLTAL